MTAVMSEINFHRGMVLMRLANTYPSLPLTLIECVQNAIDAGATRAMLCIDHSQRTVIVVDNGAGATRSKFEEALASVGNGVKDAGSLGRFGLGLISPLNKCTRFHFISAEPGYKWARRWTFEQKAIQPQHQQVSIPCDKLKTLPKLPRRFQPFAIGSFDVEWRTMVSMEGVTKDKVVSLVDIDDLESQIQSKLGAAMRAKEMAIRVVMVDDTGKTITRDIKPMHYTGDPLEEVVYDDESTGRVVFQLYRAAKRGTKRHGKVSVVAGDSNYPITMAEFTRQARGRNAVGLLSEPLKVLESGYFEGMITCEKITLAPERTKFEYDDALETLYLVIDQWFDQHGKAHYQLEQEQNREARYQQIALQTSERLQEAMSRPEFRRLWDGLMAVVDYGRLGDNHLPPQQGEVDGDDDEHSIRTGQGGAGKPRTPRTEEQPATERVHKPVDRPGDKPIGAQGPNGQRRHLVKGDSKGLWFGFEQSPLSMRLWDFDRSNGALIMNIRHPIWVQLDETNGRNQPKNEKMVQQLLEWLALEVLHLLLQFPEESDFEQYRSLIDNKVKHYVEMFILHPAR